MLNLLFISDSPNSHRIKGILQPVLRVIVDVAGDFDHGLKEVFEKRPATVLIQDQIGGVTGESVARHIQMLLGSGAPTFILLHTGTGTAKAIPGLYDYLVDMGQPVEQVAEEIKSTLIVLLGDQWEKIYIPPRPEISPVELPDVCSADPDEAANTSPDHELSGQADSVQIQQESAREALLPHAEALPVSLEEIPSVVPVAPDEPPELVPKPQAADFIINQDGPDDNSDDAVAKELHLAFETNYRSRFRLVRRSVVAVLICVVAFAAYQLTQQPQTFQRVKQRPAAGSGMPQQAPPPASTRSTPLPLNPSLAVPSVVEKATLPSYIPRDGHDKAYAAGHPGWERYLGDGIEFRVFRDAGTIQAVQVLAKHDVISGDVMAAILQESAGGTEYRITSRNSKAGVRIENGKLQRGGEILIYRKNDAIIAFVISLK